MKNIKNKFTKDKSQDDNKVIELTQDLQRVRADFENYRKRTEAERMQAIETGKMSAIFKLLPIIDNIERALGQLPEELKGNAWAEGVVSLNKNLEKSLSSLELSRIPVEKDKTIFDPALHEAISMEEEGGDKEIISEELQAGYKLGTQVIRPAMVRVAKR